MKFLAIILFLSSIHMVIAQPMNGSFTVGGSTPDFATLQEAANAIRSRGVDGPVFINIRPGTYVRQGSPGSVMVLDSIIAGISPANGITFQPDVASGGKPGNVILQVDCDVNTDYNEDRQIIKLGVDYTTFRNLTFVDADSLDAPARFLLRLNPISYLNATIEGLLVEGCNFIGSPYYTHGQSFGTDFGVYSGGGAMNVTVASCHFSNLLRAVSFDTDSDPPGDSIVVDGNRFDHLFGGYTGSGNPLGTAIELRGAHPMVRNNFVSQSGGSVAITVNSPYSGIIEGNYVQGSYANGQLNMNPPPTTPDHTDSIVVRNNVLFGSGIFAVRTGNTKVFHNTIMHGGSNNTAVEVKGAHCTVLNNIFLDYSGSYVTYDQTGSSEITSDHNIFYSVANYLVRDSAYQSHPTLSSYQLATGLDAHSKFLYVSFTIDSLGIHFDECDAQNPDLSGIPLAYVPTDFYGAIRDSVMPFIGAVEGKRIPYDMLGTPYRTGLLSPAFSLSAGRFDDPTFKSIAVTDYDNKQVRIYHNNGAGHTFSNTMIRAVGFKPYALKFYDVDEDGHDDLVVAGETTAVRVFWGDGAGNFPDDTTIITPGRVRSLDVGFIALDNLKTIIMTADNEFLPNSSFIGFIGHASARSIFWADIFTGNGTDGYYPDTIHDVLGDLTTVDLDNNGSEELVALSIGLPPYVYVFSDTAVGNQPWGHHDKQYHGSATYLGLASSIIRGDFDGDGHDDLITTGADHDSLVFLHGNGNKTFTSELIRDHSSRGIAVLDYESDGDLDFVACDNTLDSLGVSVFLNDGLGHFTKKENCHMPFASGNPLGIIAEDFDGDGKTDIAISTFDSLFVLYNLGGFNGGVTDAGTITHKTMPRQFSLDQNYPNPFNPTTSFRFQVAGAGFVSLKVYDVLGREVATIVDEQLAPGAYTRTWDAGRFSSGVYFYRLSSGQYMQTKKLLLVR